MLIIEQARITESLIMFQKISNILSIASFILITSTLGASYFGYKYVTSERFKTKLMNEVLSNVQGLLPKVLDDSLPKMTSPAMPMPMDKITTPKL